MVKKLCLIPLVLTFFLYGALADVPVVDEDVQDLNVWVGSSPSEIYPNSTFAESIGRHLLASKAKPAPAPAPKPAPAPVPKSAPAPAPKSAPVPKPAPAPAPKSAPAPAPKPAPAPAPKPAPAPVSKPAPAPAPKSAPAPKPAPAPAPKPAPAPAPKSAPAPKPAPAPAPKSAPAPKPTSVPAPTASTVISLRAKTTDKALVLKIENEFNNWLKTDKGKQAVVDCAEFQNRPDIFQGCLEDIKVTGNKVLARQGAIAEEQFRSKSKVSSSKKFCVASGDPHFTNYDGDYFHLQEKGILTLLRSNDLIIQEKVRKHGADQPGVPSCLTDLAIRYKDTLTIEISAENMKKAIINGISTTLEPEFTMKVGGVDIRYGNQGVEWRADSYKTRGVKFSFPNGFGLMVSGGYCGVVEINVPADYFGKVSGICGNADGKKDKNDFVDPSGNVMNVNYGGKNWGMSGYNGPDSPLSKWQLTWMPRGGECIFNSGCPPAPPVVAPRVVEPKVVQAPISVSAQTPKATPTSVPAPKPTSVPAPAPTPKATPTSVPTSVLVKGDLIDFPIRATCDNSFRLYVNGKEVGRGDDWRKVYSFNPKARLGVDTISIEGHDAGGPAGFIGVFNGKSSRPSDWLCKEYPISNPPSSWNVNNFDDSSWKSPVSYGSNSDKNTVWFKTKGSSLGDLASDAQWLWTNDYNNQDHIYCRLNQASVNERLPKPSAPPQEPKKSESAASSRSAAPQEPKKSETAASSRSAASQEPKKSETAASSRSAAPQETKKSESATSSRSAAPQEPKKSESATSSRSAEQPKPSTTAQPSAPPQESKKSESAASSRSAASQEPKKSESAASSRSAASQEPKKSETAASSRSAEQPKPSTTAQHSAPPQESKKSETAASSRSAASQEPKKSESAASSRSAPPQESKKSETAASSRSAASQEPKKSESAASSRSAAPQEPKKSESATSSRSAASHEPKKSESAASSRSAGSSSRSETAEQSMKSKSSSSSKSKKSRSSNKEHTSNASSKRSTNMYKREQPKLVIHHTGNFSLEHYTNASRHCINTFLAVRYDGKGNIYIGGANNNRVIHTNRTDCNGNSQGWKKVISFNPDFTRNFYISAGTLYNSHNDCGGSAYWTGHKLNQQFFQRCSWTDKSQAPLITVEIILEREKVSTHKETDINQLLGQWYLIGSTLEEKRPCVIATIYRHNSRLFYKRSVNIGNQIYQVRDHPIEKIDMNTQVFKMDKNTYKYKMTRFTIGTKDYDILYIYNADDRGEQYVFAAELYNSDTMKDIMKDKYNSVKPISLTCYKD